MGTRPLCGLNPSSSVAVEEIRAKAKVFHNGIGAVERHQAERRWERIRRRRGIGH
jgi:hypothetical protein